MTGSAANAVPVKNADHMVTSARALPAGIEVAFADGHGGLVPFAAPPEVGALPNLAAIEIPTPYGLRLTTNSGTVMELPWDFVRHYCDPAYRPRVEAIAKVGRQSVGDRIKVFREAAGMTQDRLAHAAGVGRVTLVRIERGEQSPRYETLAALASALGRPVSELVSN